MKPIDSNVSPYLQQPLRTLAQVLEERERRQREQPAKLTNGTAAAPTDAQPERAAGPAKQFDQTI